MNSAGHGWKTQIFRQISSFWFTFSSASFVTNDETDFDLFDVGEKLWFNEIGRFMLPIKPWRDESLARTLFSIEDQQQRWFSIRKKNEIYFEFEQNSLYLDQIRTNSIHFQWDDVKMMVSIMTSQNNWQNNHRKHEYGQFLSDTCSAIDKASAMIRSLSEITSFGNKTWRDELKHIEFRWFSTEIKKTFLLFFSRFSLKSSTHKIFHVRWAKPKRNNRWNRNFHRNRKSTSKDLRKHFVKSNREENDDRLTRNRFEFDFSTEQKTKPTSWREEKRQKIIVKKNLFKFN